MKVQLPKSVIKILESLSKNNFESYIVGGAVRDILMGKLVYDWDFTTNATPDEIQKIFPNSYCDNQFGTVGIPSEIEGERPYEITTFRTEHGYSDLRRPDKVKWGKSLEEDLKRRDFTINAMALRNQKSKTKNQKSSETEVELIDIFEGKKDLQNKLIRAVGDPSERFREDALRMMRAVRIASELGFSIEKETTNAIRDSAKLINKIAKERVRDELIKILKSPHPYEGMEIFRKVGLMQEVLPELENAFGVEQKSPGRHHIYDVGTHCLYSLKFVSEKNEDPIVRLATLIHDLGKPATFRKDENGLITFYNHEIVSAKIAARIAERLRFSNNQSERLYKLVRYHQFSVNEDQTDNAIRRFIRNVGIDNVNDMIDLRVGDRLGGGASETSWRLEDFKKRLIEVQKQPFSIKDLKINGNDVMKTLGIKSGPKVGETLERIFEMVEKKKIENTRKILLTHLRTLQEEVN